MRISDWSSDVCSSDLPPGGHVAKPMRILVIEDNQDIAANLGDYLEDRGHTVDFAADGVTGLHLAVVHDSDAIVLDLNLPGMDGLRSEERRVGKECVSTCRARWSPYHEKKNQ